MDFNGLKIGAVSLGCSKNRVDTELMLGALPGAGFVADPHDADVIIVNTCGFIETAKQESIDTILEMAQLKKTGALKALIVAGCLAERYRDELADELPEADAFLGVNAYEDIAAAIEDALKGKPTRSFHESEKAADFAARPLTTPPYQAYIKIAEGCSNRCAYCAIPMIRGPLKSRSPEDIENEVRTLAERGVSEFILVAQDTTMYGRDIGTDLTALIDRIAPIEGVHWLRLLYCYPENVTISLIYTMLKYANVCRYIDMPAQHFDDEILRRMNRRNSRESTFNAMHMLKQAGFTARTTLIAGFPGETKEQHEDMVECVKTLKFDRLGVFPFCPEDGTAAAVMPDQIEEEEKQRRADAVMEAQMKISRESCEACIVRELELLVEYEEEGGYVCRAASQAPEIDGVSHLATDKKLAPGTYVRAIVVDADDYDLYCAPAGGAD